MQLYELTDYLDRFLEIDGIDDVALNGLQIEGSQEINKIAFTVDCSLKTLKVAAAEKADILICHHGLYWPSIGAITGNTLKRVKSAIENNLSVYASHLPLDIHPIVGNNIEIANMLNCKILSKFGMFKRQKIGVVGLLPEPIELSKFINKIDEILYTDSKLIKAENGKEQIQVIGIISGSASSNIHDAIKLGLDLFLTGESSHSVYNTVVENKTHMLSAGHYKTETIGIKALQRHIEEMFNIGTIFIDAPTGI